MLTPINQKSLLIYFSWLTTVLLIIAMFIVALLPENRLQEYPSLLDRLIKDGGHVLGFLVFAFSLQLSILLSFGKKCVAKYIGYAAGPLLALFTELLQQYAPGREASVIDFTLDLVGSIIGAALAIKAYGALTNPTEEERGDYPKLR